MTMLIISILFSALLTAPPNNTVMIFEAENIRPYEPVMNATGKIESNFDPFAIGDKDLSTWSYGIYQIRQSRLDDYFRQTGIRYSLTDMFDVEKSKKVFLFYASQYHYNDIESISRSWNGGPRWREKKSTIKYYKKILKAI